MQTLWLEADVRGIYPTYLIVEEVSKTIEKYTIVYIYIQLFSRDLWDIHPAKEQKKPTQLLNKT